jgi:MFS family permease
VAFSLFGLWTMPTGFMISAILFGLTAWSIPAIITAICGEMMGAKLAPAALGFITLFFGVGQALGPIIAGAMADAAGSLLPAYLFAAGVAVIGIIGASQLKPALKKEPEV